MITSAKLIKEAVEAGRATVTLSDGDVHVCDLSQHQFPDVVCAASGCTKAYDSRLVNLAPIDRWRNEGAVSAITKRDNWRHGLCPDHC